MQSSAARPEGAVFTLQSHEIQAHWVYIAPHLARVCEDFPDDLNLDALKADLTAARKQLWGFHDGAIVTGVAVTEIQHPVCWLRAGAGTETFPGQIDEVLFAIEGWARDIGCQRIKLMGRVGWKRRLPSFHQIGIILEKPL